MRIGRVDDRKRLWRERWAKLQKKARPGLVSDERLQIHRHTDTRTLIGREKLWRTIERDRLSELTLVHPSLSIYFIL